MPTDFPRRQTTSQGRPVRASRENANRNFAGNALRSSIVILAPVADMFSTSHRRAANPPSNVIQPGWRSDLRKARFLGAEAIFLGAGAIFGYPGNSIPTPSQL